MDSTVSNETDVASSETDMLIPLVPNNQQNNTKNITIAADDGYNYLEIGSLLTVRIMVDFVFKNPLIFWDNYASGLGLTSMEFAYILVATEVGCVLALFVGQMNERYFKSYANIMLIYLVVNGVATMLFPVSLYFSAALSRIVWCCFFRIISGLAFAFITTASLKFGSQSVSKEKASTIIAILHYSWPISTVLNIFAGYVIEDISWTYVFIFAGIALLMSAVGLKLLFVWYRETQGYTKSQMQIQITSQQYDGIYTLLADKNSMLIIWGSFWMSIKYNSIYVVCSSLWLEDSYGLSTIDVGYATIAIIIGEVAALAAVGFFTFRFALWKSTVGSLIIQFLFSGLILCILSVIYYSKDDDYDNMIGPTYDSSLVTALIFIVLMAGGHQSFYVIQQTNAIFYTPKASLTFLLLLAERMSQETAAIFAFLATSILWSLFYHDAILIFSCIWMVSIAFEAFVLFIYV